MESFDLSMLILETSADFSSFYIALCIGIAFLLDFSEEALSITFLIKSCLSNRTSWASSQGIEKSFLSSMSLWNLIGEVIHYSSTFLVLKK